MLLCFISVDFGKTFTHINAEIFNTQIRKDNGILKSPVNPDKVCGKINSYQKNKLHAYIGFHLSVIKLKPNQ